MTDIEQLRHENIRMREALTRIARSKRRLSEFEAWAVADEALSAIRFTAATGDATTTAIEDAERAIATAAEALRVARAAR